MAVKGPTGKPVKDTYAPKPAYQTSPHSGPGIGKGGDKKSSDAPIPGPRRKKS